jgi:hypothetical protein
MHLAGWKFTTLALAGAVLLTLGGAVALAQRDAPGSYQETSPGLLSRPVFKADAGNTTIEIIDLLVGPGMKSEPMVLDGGALLDVQGGTATLVVDGKGQSVQPGNVVPLAQGRRFAIDNSRAQRSFVARLILLSRPGAR